MINIGIILGIEFEFICILPYGNLIKTPIENNTNTKIEQLTLHKITSNARTFFYFFSFFLFDKIAKKGHFIGVFVDFFLYEYIVI